jgi:hypothetical protein
MAIWHILWSFRTYILWPFWYIFLQFWHFVPRKIWQPCRRPGGTHKPKRPSSPYNWHLTGGLTQPGVTDRARGPVCRFYNIFHFSSAAHKSRIREIWLIRWFHSNVNRTSSFARVLLPRFFQCVKNVKMGLGYFHFFRFFCWTFSVWQQWIFFCRRKK